MSTLLIEAIRNQLDDDLARLAFADWLEETGQPERAELIRVQIQKHGLPEDDDHAVDLQARAESLQARHERDWLGVWADRLVRWRFERGFLDSVTMHPEVFLGYGEELFRQHPVREVRFVGDDGEACGAEIVEDVITCPTFARVRALDASGSVPSAGGAWCRALVRASHLNQIEELNFSSSCRQDGVFDDVEALTELCQADHLHGLRKLGLAAPMAWVMPGDEIVAPLVGAVFASRLETLRLAGMGITDAGLRQLINCPALRHLESLDLSWCEYLTRDGVGELLASESFPALRELGLGGEFSPADLGRSPLLGHLKALDLATNTRRFARNLPFEEWRTFARSPHVGGLRRLTLLFSLIDDAGARALFHTPSRLRLRSLMVMGHPQEHNSLPEILATAPSLAGLTSFEAPGCHIDGQGVETLLTAPFVPNLRLFCVAGNPIEARGIAAITRSRLSPQRLDELHLHHCDLRPSTLRRLFRWRGLANVTKLEITSNALDPEVIQLLARSGCGEQLTTLQVSSGIIPVEGLRELARVPGLPRLRTISLPRTIGAEGLEALRQRFGARVKLEQA